MYLINIDMKNALIIGGGSKWGASFTKNLAQNNYHVDVITGSGFSCNNVTTHKIDWWGSNLENLKVLLDPLRTKKYDMIFFNQNSGGGPNEQYFGPNQSFSVDHWHQQNWINCMLTYYTVQILSDCILSYTKVGWMLTGLIDGKDKEMWKYAGYASIKSTNLHIMRGFANQHRGIFFGLNPIWFPETQHEEDADTIRCIIENLELKDNGCTIDKNANYWI